jgi:ABC-type transporter Mla MlaB component
MLRITTIQEDGSAATLKLEGKLLEPWIGELLNACRQSSEAAGPVTLDLARLSYVDAPGTIVLRDLRCRGVTLTGCTPLVAELLKENE